MKAFVDAAEDQQQASYPPSDAAREILDPFGAVIALTAIVKVLGFVEKQFLAYYFGADSRVDVFLVASSIAMTLWLTVRELAEPTFMPAFVRAVDEGAEDTAWGIFLTFGAASSLVLLALSVAPLACPDAVVRFLAPGLTPQAASLAAASSRVAAAAGWFLGLSSLTYMTLNAQRRFIWPAAGDVVQKLTSILGCAIAGACGAGTHGLAWAFFAGAILRPAVHVCALRSDLPRLRSARLPGALEVRALRRLTAPIAFGVVMANVSNLAENHFLSLCEVGSIAATAYARKVADLPILLVPYGLSVVLYPHLSKLAARKDMRSFTEAMGTSARALALFVVPVAISVFLLADSVVAIIFQRGAFDQEARLLSASILRVYSVGLLTFALEAIVVPSFFARQDTRSPIVFGAFGVLLNVTTTAVLFKTYGAAGVAASLVISKTAKLVALGSRAVACAQQGGWRSLVQESSRLAVAATWCIACGTGWLALWPPRSDASLLFQLLHLIASVVCIFASFLSAVCLFPSERAFIKAGVQLAIRS